MEELFIPLSTTVIYGLLAFILICLTLIFTAALNIIHIEGNSFLNNLGINTLGILIGYILQTYLPVVLFMTIFFVVSVKLVYQEEWVTSILASSLYGIISLFGIAGFSFLLVIFLDYLGSQ